MAKKRGSSWEGTVTHKGARHRRSFATENEAELWELDSKAKLIKGESIDMGDKAAKRRGDLPYTLGELVQHVYDTHWAPMPSGAKQLINANLIVAEIGASLPVAKLGKADVDRARAKLLAAGNAPGTVNRKVAALSKCLSEAEDLGIIERKPKCNKYKESEHRVRRFTPDEEKKTLAFFERIGHQDMADYTVLSLDTGMRQSEVLSLHFEDVDNGRVTVWGVGATGQRTKSGKSRTVPLTARAQAVFERRRKVTNGKAVFPSLSKNSVAHYWGRLSEVLNLESDKQFVPHILRHEFCSRLASNGENAAAIQKLAGHATLLVTQRYIHLFGDELDDVIGRMEKKETLAGNRATTVIVDEIETDTQALAQLLSQLPQDQLKAIFKTVITAP